MILKISCIPTILTTLNAFLGFSSIFFSLQHEWGIAAVLVFTATIMDLFDGRVARLLGVNNSLGKEMDSFADFLSFGVAPGVMVITYVQSFFIINNIHYLFAYITGFIYTLCVALRLAIFNNPSGTYMARVKKSHESDFIGIPSTFMGGILTFFIGFNGFSEGLLGHYITYNFFLSKGAVIVLTFIASFLLLVPVPFPKTGRILFAFKAYPKINFIIVLSLILFCKWALLLMSSLYIICSFIVFFKRKIFVY